MDSCRVEEWNGFVLSAESYGAQPILFGNVNKYRCEFNGVPIHQQNGLYRSHYLWRSSMIAIHLSNSICDLVTSHHAVELPLSAKLLFCQELPPCSQALPLSAVINPDWTGNSLHDGTAIPCQPQVLNSCIILNHDCQPFLLSLSTMINRHQASSTVVCHYISSSTTNFSFDEITESSSFISHFSAICPLMHLSITSVIIFNHNFDKPWYKCQSSLITSLLITVVITPSITIITIASITINHHKLTINRQSLVIK